MIKKNIKHVCQISFSYDFPKIKYEFLNYLHMSEIKEGNFPMNTKINLQKGGKLRI